MNNLNISNENWKKEAEINVILVNEIESLIKHSKTISLLIIHIKKKITKIKKKIIFIQIKDKSLIAYLKYLVFMIFNLIQIYLFMKFLSKLMIVFKYFTIYFTFF
jgi:hypothetical protein